MSFVALREEHRTEHSRYARLVGRAPEFRPAVLQSINEMDDDIVSHRCIGTYGVYFEEIVESVDEIFLRGVVIIQLGVHRHIVGLLQLSEVDIAVFEEVVVQRDKCHSRRLGGSHAVEQRAHLDVVLVAVHIVDIQHEAVGGLLHGSHQLGVGGPVEEGVSYIAAGFEFLLYNASHAGFVLRTRGDDVQVRLARHAAYHLQQLVHLALDRRHALEHVGVALHYLVAFGQRVDDEYLVSQRPFGGIIKLFLRQKRYDEVASHHVVGVYRRLYILTGLARDIHHIQHHLAVHPLKSFHSQQQSLVELDVLEGSVALLSALVDVELGS